VEEVLTKRPLILALAFGAAFTPACGSGNDTNPLAPTPTTTVPIPEPPPPPPQLKAAAGVTIKEIALYQAVKRPLMADGMPATSDIPIVAGRDALLRVFVNVDASHDLTAQLFFVGDPTPIEIVQTIPASSTDDKLISTLNFDIPGARITPTTKYRVVIGEPNVEKAADAQALAYPATDSDPIPGESVGETLKIVLVPIAYGANGVLPPLTEAQIKMYTDGFRAMYPSPKLELTVRSEPIVWKNTISPNGAGWSALLDHVAYVRMADKVGPDVYYYAPFTPTASFGSFCGGGCVAGLGMLGDAGDSYSRASIGLGYADPDSIVTALHEVGHNHGRQHAPCDVPNADPQYPHKGGEDGVWGYNLITKQLFPPTTTDIMGYCLNVWISDYTYTALFDRIKLINAAKRVVVPEALKNRLYDRALVNQDGSVQWLSSLRMEDPPMAEEKSVVVESDGLTETVTGSFYRFDHVEGGILFWPASERQTKAIRVDVAAGKSVQLTR
jgi:hypothetical protein